MKLHILSDIHIEYSPYCPEQVEADVIVLAGDIGHGASGIAWARQSWPDKEIIFVPGNHEYYRSEIGIENEMMERAAEIYAVRVLNRSEVFLDGVRFLGATLWTDFLLFGVEEKKYAQLAAVNAITDFRVIDYGAQTFMPQDCADLNAADVAWLEQKLTKGAFDGPTVVVTHHSPSTLSVAERYKKDLVTACFASNLDRLFGYSCLWVHGHTHDSFDYVANGTRVVCNPRGYCKAGHPPENHQFDASLVVGV